MKAPEKIKQKAETAIRFCLEKYRSGKLKSVASVNVAIRSALEAQKHTIHGDLVVEATPEDDAIYHVSMMIIVGGSSPLQIDVWGNYFPGSSDTGKQEFHLTVVFYRRGDWFVGEISFENGPTIAVREAKTQGIFSQYISETKLLPEGVHIPKDITTTPQIISYILECMSPPEPEEGPEDPAPENQDPPDDEQ